MSLDKLQSPANRLSAGPHSSRRAIRCDCIGTLALRVAFDSTLALFVRGARCEALNTRARPFERGFPATPALIEGF
jgi:hypothetical protein